MRGLWTMGSPCVLCMTSHRQRSNDLSVDDVRQAKVALDVAEVEWAALHAEQAAAAAERIVSAD